MFSSLQNPLSLIGRLLLALLFVPAGFSKIAGFSGTAGYIASKGIPLPELAAAVAVGVELGLGLLLLVGWQTRWAALGIAFFTFVISFIFHNFWTMPADQQMMQSLMFFKNMAIVGGLLTVAAWGAGAWSFDGKRSA
ncbi:DoxX family protein [Polaromonas sp.]|uniref:DoxX family protein n=1 Tax=Polaromonas sp. TaxID=1869339 RepID=UPI0017B4E474|nr:DoxX family protein [Polaromonas sp.]NML87040.1 DoxX family protein [Polaromonas sp.]